MHLISGRSSGCILFHFTIDVLIDCVLVVSYSGCCFTFKAQYYSLKHQAQNRGDVQTVNYVDEDGGMPLLQYSACNIAWGCKLDFGY